MDHPRTVARTRRVKAGSRSTARGPAAPQHPRAIKRPNPQVTVQARSAQAGRPWDLAPAAGPGDWGAEATRGPEGSSGAGTGCCPLLRGTLRRRHPPRTFIQYFRAILQECLRMTLSACPDASQVTKEPRAEFSRTSPFFQETTRHLHRNRHSETKACFVGHRRFLSRGRSVPRLESWSM